MKKSSLSYQAIPQQQNSTFKTNSGNAKRLGCDSMLFLRTTVAVQIMIAACCSASALDQHSIKRPTDDADDRGNENIGKGRYEGRKSISTPDVVDIRKIFGDESGIKVATSSEGRPTPSEDLLSPSPQYSIKCNTLERTAFVKDCTRFLLQDYTKTPDEGYTASIQRISSYSGGKNGFENAALRVINKVGPDNANYEDAMLAILNSHHATSGQNVAIRAQANKFGTGSVWSAANETLDHTGKANPTSALIGIEQVVAANGTDDNNNRVAYDAIASRPQDRMRGGYLGPAVEIGYGFRVVRQVADIPRMARFKVGMTFGTSASPTDFDRAIDLRYATFSKGGYAVHLGTGQSISFETGGGRSWDWTQGQMNYRVDGTPTFWLTDAGNIVSAGKSLRVGTPSTPESSKAPCETGTIQWDASYTYVCVAINTWKRSALTSW